MDDNAKIEKNIKFENKLLEKLFQNIIWWVLGDSNPGPLGYEPSALTS